MTLVKNSAKLIDSEKPSKPTKAGIRIISEMSTWGIVRFLAYKHRVGLLAIASLVGWGTALGVGKFIGYFV